MATLAPTRTSSLAHSATTLITSSSTSNTTSSPSSEPTEQPPLDLFSADTSSDGDETLQDTTFNYYFLFLAVFGAGITVLLWWLHRRRKQRKELIRLSGQNALARDLEGWTGTRRFMHGRYGGNHACGCVQRQEGLDEHGEAPPQYQAKNAGAVPDDPVGTAHDPVHGVTIPLRTLPRDEIERSWPPEYCVIQEPDPNVSTTREATRS